MKYEGDALALAKLQSAELRAQGLSYATIAKRLSVSEMTVYFWLNPQSKAKATAARTSKNSARRCFFCEVRDSQCAGGLVTNGGKLLCPKCNAYSVRVGIDPHSATKYAPKQ